MADYDDELELQADDTQDDEVSIEYDIATYPSDFTLQGIVDMWNDDGIKIPEFQREFVWTIKQSSLFVLVQRELEIPFSVFCNKNI